MRAVDFWQLLKRCRPDPSGFFDDPVQRALELAMNRDDECIAWVKLEWPAVEFYLYDTSDVRDRVTPYLYPDTTWRRPTDHGQEMDCDWLVTIKEPRL